MSKYEIIKNALDEMDRDELLQIWNEYCAEYDTDNYIYNMNELDEMLAGLSPWEAIRMSFYGEFNPWHDYFWFNGYGNLESSDYPEDNIYTADLADYIERNEDALYNDDIQTILDEYGAA